ncbi:MAG: pirin family protein [Myxococcota bacterium]|jgi:quercetin 2,3-dioxygenase|nr:pirin family protein [Myxococcota bacterium]
MIALRRAQERHHEKRRTHESWLTFPVEGGAPLEEGFGALEFLEEYSISPAARVVRRARRDSEHITYVHAGSLTQEDSSGATTVMQAGEFRRAAGGRGVRYSQVNPSATDPTHVIQASLRASQVGLSLEGEQRRFSVAERRNGLCVVASLDGRGGSLRLHQAALVHSALLDRGRHLAYELPAGRSAWLHVLCGELTLDGLLLTAGDGAGLQDEPAVSFTATGETEVLLLDVSQRGATC